LLVVGMLPVSMPEATGPENCVLRVMERSFADPSPIYPPGKDGEGPHEKRKGPREWHPEGRNFDENMGLGGFLALAVTGIEPYSRPDVKASDLSR
jgi:hypothetical protein